MTIRSTDCLYCIDGMATIDSALLGHCFRDCPNCQPACDCCEGEGRYPAWTNDLSLFIDTYKEVGLTPLLCQLCLGVVGIARLDEVTPT